MGHSKHVLLFIRSATERLLDAQVLLEKDRTTGAIYLAGYAVECVLKALILNQTRQKDQKSVIDQEFRGTKAHDYRWLLSEYNKRGGPQAPPTIRRDLTLVSLWDVSRRYEPGRAAEGNTRDFLNSAHRILDWANERLA